MGSGSGFGRKHYTEYLVSLINAHTLDPALLYEAHELVRACERYQVDVQRGEAEDDNVYQARLLKVGRSPAPAVQTYKRTDAIPDVANVFYHVFLCQKLMEVPLGEKVPRKK